MSSDRIATTAAVGARFLAGSNEDRPALAAMLMVSSLCLLGLQDSFVKLASSEVSLWQFQLLRSVCNLLLLVCLSRFLWGSARPVPQNLGAVALRSLFLVGAMVLFFGGIPFLSLSEIAAGLYVFPLFVAILSTVVLGERVGPRRIMAILAGLAGTLLILKPGTEAFRWVGLMPVAAGLCYAATVLTTRKLCRQESPVTLTFGVSVAFIVVGTLGLSATSVMGPSDLAVRWPYLFTGWHALDPAVALIIVVCSCLNLTSNIGLAKAYQSAEASWLAPFDYSYLIFATFWGIVMWGHVPDLLSFAGMGLIATSGCYVAWRERQDSQLRRAEMNRLLR